MILQTWSLRKRIEKLGNANQVKDTRLNPKAVWNEWIVSHANPSFDLSLFNTSLYLVSPVDRYRNYLSPVAPPNIYKGH